MKNAREVHLPESRYWHGKIFTVNGHKYRVIGFETVTGKVVREETKNSIPVLEELEVVNFD